MSAADYGFGFQSFGDSPFGYADPPEPDPATSGPLAAPYLAVDMQPDNLAGVFELGVSELGGPDVLGWLEDDAGSWTNIVCDVQRVHLRRGATRLQGVLTRAEAGVLSIEATDTEGTLDPLLNGDAIHKGIPVRLRAWSEYADPDTGAPVFYDVTLFTGTVDVLTATYSPTEPARVTIAAVDLIADLAAWESDPSPYGALGAGEGLGQRAARVLAAVGRGSVAPTSDTAFTVGLNPTTLERGWQTITEAADAELGRVWVDEANRLVLRSRWSELTGPIRGTLSDVHGEAPTPPHVCMAAADVVYGAETLANRALASRRLLDGEDPAAALVVRRDDVNSQARYGPATLDRRGNLELASDAQLAAWADAVVYTSATPELRVDRVQPVVPDLVLEEAQAAWPAVVSTTIGDRWTFLFHPLHGHTVQRTLGVLGVELDLSPDDWSITWTTTEATSAVAFFVLGDSELGGADILAPYAVPLPAP